MQKILFTALGILIGVIGCMIFTVNDTDYSKKYHSKLAMTIQPDEPKPIYIHFATGMLTLHTSKNNQILSGKLSSEDEGHKDNFVKTIESPEKTEITILSNDFHGEIAIPANTAVFLNGNTGSVIINEPKYDLNVKLQTGSINFNKAENIAYTFNTFVGTGTQKRFVSESTAEAYKISIDLQTGSIR